VKTSSKMITGLDPTANYYFNVTAVDRVKFRQWQVQDLILQRTTTAEGPRLRTDRQVMIADPGDSVELSSQLLDIGGNPWADQTVTYSLDGELGSLAEPTNQVTNLDGRATNVLLTDSDKGSHYYTVEVNHPDVPLPLEYVVYVTSQPDKQSQENVKTVPFK
jgi:hypothetical protein